MKILPSKLKEKVLVRGNAEKNILSLSRNEKRELWKCMSELASSSMFSVHKKLSHYIKQETDNGFVFYGSIIRRAFIAVVQIAGQSLRILSVISIGRLNRSKNGSSCVLVNDTLKCGVFSAHIFSGVDQQKNIFWRHEIRDQRTNSRVHLRGFQIVTRPIVCSWW